MLGCCADKPSPFAVWTLLKIQQLSHKHRELLAVPRRLTLIAKDVVLVVEKFAVGIRAFINVESDITRMTKFICIPALRTLPLFICGLKFGVLLCTECHRDYR